MTTEKILTNSTKTILAEACYTTLKPLASILLKSGLTWKEFCGAAKLAFVDVATLELGKRTASISSVSNLTGIESNDVKRLFGLLESANSKSIRSTSADAARLLSGWHQDSLYLNKRGEPLELPLDGPAPNFIELLKQYGGDTPAHILRRELGNAGAVEFTERNTVIALTRYFMPKVLSEEKLVNLGIHLGSHAQTLKNNLLRTQDTDALFEGTATENLIHPRHAREFNDFLNKRGEQFLEEIDDWLTQKRLEDGSQNETIKLGVGLYAIDSSKEQRTTS